MTPARAIVAIAVTAIITAGLYRWSTRPVVRVPIAIVPFANHTGETDLDAYRLALTAALIRELSESPNAHVTPYMRLIEILRRFVGTQDFSSSEAIQAIAGQAAVRFVIVPTLEYRSGGTWLARAEIRSAETGATVRAYETEPTTSVLPKETAYRLMMSLGDALQRHFKENGPGVAYEPMPAHARFRNIEAARAFEQGLNEYEQLEYGAARDAFERAGSLDDQQLLAKAWLSRVSVILNRRNDAVAAGEAARRLLATDTPASDRALAEAVAAESHGDVATAERRYRESAALHSDDAAGHAQLGEFFRRHDRSDAAVEAFHAALRLDSNYTWPHVELCQLYAGGLGNLPLAEQHAQTALRAYQHLGNRLGEAQAYLCLSEAQRKQGGRHVGDARTSAAEARSIFETLKRPYNLSRVYQYQGIVEYTDGDFAAAAGFLQEAAAQARAAGNPLIEGLALMNLGATYNDLAHRPSAAIDYYTQSRNVFERMDDQRRAAEATVNLAHVQIEYGSDRADAMRRLTSARATLEKLGYVDFAIDARVLLAASLRYEGKLGEARRELAASASTATDRHLNNRIAVITLETAKTDFLLNNYDSVRGSLESLVGADGGQARVEAQILLGSVLERLGDFDSARQQLEAALMAVEAQHLSQLAPLVRTALGELAYDMGHSSDAITHFAKAAAVWTDPLPDAAAIDATSFLGVLDMGSGTGSTARQRAEDSLQRATQLGRLDLEVRCRVHVAEIAVREGRHRDAAAVLTDSLPGEGQVIGPELEAQVHYWRSRALAPDDPVRAGAEAMRARAQIEQLRASMPGPFRDRFSLRTVIRQLSEDDAVQKRPQSR